MTPPAIKCRIWWDVNASAYVVSCGFNETFIEALKHFIPSKDRLYDPATKLWYLKEVYGEMIKTLAEAKFGVGSVSFQSRTVAEQAQAQQRRASPPPPTVGGTAFLNPLEAAMVEFMSLMPYQALKAAYRAAALDLHPDKNQGSSEKMIRLNDLFRKLESEVYKK